MEVDIKTEQFEIGDRIKVIFEGESHMASAIKREADGMLFVLDECLDERKQMNTNSSNEGGYDKSDLRKYLQQKAMGLPEDFRNKLVPFENGDIFRLIRLAELTGEDTKWGKVCEPLDFFKDRKQRVAYCKEIDGWSWYWLEDVIVTYSTLFAACDGLGNSGSRGASRSGGVRPLFKIRVSEEDL
jgi:hypothetical protein